MAKTDTPSATTTAGDTLRSNNIDTNELIQSLTAAIVASRRDRREASQQAKDAAIEYALIKRVLGTHAEPFATNYSGTGANK